MLTAGHVHSAHQLVHSFNLLVRLDVRPRGKLRLPQVLSVWQLGHATTYLECMCEG